MALTKDTAIDKIEILEDGVVQVRRAMYIVEDGERIAGPRYLRAAYVPGQDISHETVKVRAIADIVWTQAVINAYREKTEQARL